MLDLPYKELPKGWDETSRYDYFDDKINGHLDGIRFIGDSTEIYSFAYIKGSFSIGHGYQDSDFPTNLDFTVRDYGGLSGEVNTVEKRLHIIVPFEDGPTELVPRNP